MTTITQRFSRIAVSIAVFAAATSAFSWHNAHGRPPARHSPRGRSVVPPTRVVRPAPAVRVIKPAPFPSPAAAIARSVSYLLAPPVGHVVVRLGDVTYYRYGHSYYRPYWHGGRWVYVSVAPPIGVPLSSLPPTPDRVVINGQVYYRHGATFYVEKTIPTAAETTTMDGVAPQPQYVVTKAPVGAVVAQLPKDAISVQTNGTNYFHADGIYYLPIRVGEDTKYVVVDKPT